MKYQSRQEGSLTIVEIEGNMVGGPAADAFREFISELIEGGARRMIFDLSRVRYVASPGAGMIIATYTTLAKKGGTLRLVINTERVKNLIHLIQLYRILEIYETLQEAIDSFETPPAEKTSRDAPLDSNPGASKKRDEAVSAG